MIIYKSITKQQGAEDAGVSIGVFRSWCKQFEEKMIPLGYKTKCKVLNPACVRILAEHYCFMPRNAKVI